MAWTSGILALAALSILRVACAEEECVDDGTGSCQAGGGIGADSVLIQRAWSQDSLAKDGPDVQAQAESHAEALARSPADYDCNGDGVPDCGKWNYRMGMCENQAYCGHLYKLGDWDLGLSCRCRRCDDPAFQGTAFGDAQLQKPDGSLFDAMSWSTFRNWADHLDTCAPWIMPRSDGDLRNALAYARSKGYKVRISGAGHSAGGIVTDGKDANTFVISLAEYATTGEWQFGMRDMPDGSKRATVNAGWTQAHLYAKVRPLGFFLPAQTAGYFFALGGIVANSVHGGAYKAGFVHSYATRMRVMLYDGSIKIIEDEEEVRYWRCSFGMLGIILGIEFQLEHREQLQMYSVKKQMDGWSAESFWSFMKQDAEADVPGDIVPEGGAGSRKSWNGEYFVNWIGSVETPTVLVYAQKANSSVDADFNGPLGMPQNIEQNYAALLDRKVTDDWHGRMTWGEAARRDGSPPIEIMGLDVNDVLDAMKWAPMAKIMSSQAVTNIPRLVRTLGNKVNDGFFLKDSAAALAAAYFVEPAKAFEAMDYFRSVQLASRGSKEFVWNLPGEFRFINVQDSAVLQPVKAGLWFNAQMISFADLAKDDQAWKRDFKKVEDYWVKHLGAKPHMGKLWGFETSPEGEVEPFADSFACSIYSDETKAKFNEYRKSQDPEDLFFAGLGPKLVTPCA